MTLKKFLAKLFRATHNEAPLLILDRYMKSRGLSLFPTTTENNYVIEGFGNEPDKLVSVYCDPKDGSLFCAVMSKFHDRLLRHGSVENVSHVLALLDSMCSPEQKAGLGYGQQAAT